MRIPDKVDRPVPAALERPASPAETPANAGKIGEAGTNEAAAGLDPGAANVAGQAGVEATRLAFASNDDFKSGGPLAATMAQKASEPTSDADLEAVSAEVAQLIEQMGEKPSDVRVAGKFELNRPEIEKPVDTSALPAEWMFETANRLGDRGLIVDDAVADALTAKVEQATIDRLISTLPPPTQAAVAKLTEQVQTRFAEFLPASVAKALRHAKLTGTEAKAEPGAARTAGKDASKRMTDEVDEGVRFGLGPVSLPGPDVLAFEKSLGSTFGSLPVGDGDIDSLVQIVMMECGRDATDDLRSMINEVKANNAQKKAVREHVVALKKQQAEMQKRLRHEYDVRCASDDKNLHIEPSITSFEDYCASQQLAVKRGDPNAVDENGLPVGGLALDVSANVVYYPQKGPEIFDGNGNKIPAQLVLEARRLKVAPEALADLKAMWSKDASLRKHVSFEAFLLSPKASGGLGLTLPATASQDGIVNAFITDWKTKNSDVDLSNVSGDSGGNAVINISEQQRAALREYFNAANPGAGNEAFESWLTTSAPAGPGLSPGMSNATAAVNAFFNAAKDGGNVDKDPFAGLTLSTGPNVEADIVRIGLSLLKDPVLTAKLNDALAKYVNDMMALGAAKAWANDWVGEQETQMKASRDALTTAINAFGDDKDFAKNYVNALLVNGHKMLERSKTDAGIGNPFRSSSVICKGLCGSNNDCCVDCKGKTHWIWGPSEANVYDPLLLADTTTFFSKVDCEAKYAANKAKNAAAAKAKQYADSPPPGPPAGAGTNNDGRITSSLSADELEALEASYYPSVGKTQTEILRELMTSPPSGTAAYSETEKTLHKAIVEARGRLNPEDASRLDDLILDVNTQIAEDTVHNTKSFNHTKTDAKSQLAAKLRVIEQTQGPAARAKAEAYVQLQLAEIARDLGAAGLNPSQPNGIFRTGEAFLNTHPSPTQPYTHTNHISPWGHHQTAPQWSTEDQNKWRDGLTGFLTNDLHVNTARQPDEKTGAQVKALIDAEKKKTPAGGSTNNNTNNNGGNNNGGRQGTGTPPSPAVSAAIAQLVAAEERDKPPVYSDLRQISMGELKAVIDEWEGKKDTLGDITNELAMKLQLYQDRRAKIFDMLSNMMKKASETRGNIVANLKG
ncbi:MAG: hypothetical protein IT381_02265 [Deltaproteobacteria bacterium]|nr:hypothetical protein [Deltaproteobacteria bacterium]